MMRSSTLAEQDLPSPLETPDGAKAAELLARFQGAAPMLCIAGRGPFDEAAATVLAQLLTKHGLTARTAPHEAVSRRDVAQLNLDGIAMIFVVYLAIDGMPSHLRYLLQRLRERVPAAKLVVGLWRSGEKVLNDADAQQELGADLLVTTMRGAVEVGIAEATGGKPARPALSANSTAG